MGMTFHNYRTLVETVRHTLKVDWPVRRCLAYAFESVTSDPRRYRGKPIDNGIIETTLEQDFYDHGRPYYKIWPTILDMICYTSIDIPGRAVQLPYPAFVIRLPTGPHALKFGEQKISSIMVGIINSDALTILTIDGKEVECGRAMRVTYQYLDGNKSAIDVGLFDEETIQEGFERWGERESKFAQPPSIKSPKEIRRRLIATAIAVSLFGIDRHELILPDIPREEIVVRGKGKRRLAQQRREREVAKCRGWLVGSEIDLPRPHVYRTGHSEPTGKELEHGHVRSGHMRMQPCGKENKDRKLIFLAPTVVRPDLPMRTTHGYRIQDKLLKTAAT